GRSRLRRRSRPHCRPARCVKEIGLGCSESGAASIASCWHSNGERAPAVLPFKMTVEPQIPAWLAREYPFAPRTFVTPDGARMNYVDEGPRQADTVLMLHGNPTWSYYYRHLV